MFTMSGLKPMPEPRALDSDELAQTVRDYARAAAQGRRRG
jgi:2,4-dienoyl-CoA reductase-like NADH-dependent reductase (Old Yellow Enzyme family)